MKSPKVNKDFRQIVLDLLLSMKRVARQNMGSFNKSILTCGTACVQILFQFNEFDRADSVGIQILLTTHHIDHFDAPQN